MPIAGGLDVHRAQITFDSASPGRRARKKEHVLPLDGPKGTKAGLPLGSG